MKILIVSNLFHPDSLAGASLYTDMARFFRDRGHEVRVTCTFSYYPAWRLRPEDEGVLERVEEFERIPVKRIPMYVPETPSGMRRIMSDMSFLWSLLRRGTWPNWKPDVVLTAEPMLSQCLAQRMIYPDVPKFIIVQDFVVDAALTLGLVKIPGVGRILHSVERWGLRSACRLSSISPAMTDRLREIVGPDRTVSYIPNWVHASLKKAVEEARQRREQPREEGRLFYSGNVGVKQGLPQFIEQFDNAGAPGWHLRIHGGGAEIDSMRRRAQKSPAVTVGDLLEEDSYAEHLLNCSACLITQQPNVSASFLPSKLLAALAAGTPVLAVCDPESPLGQEVVAAECGVVVPPGDAETLQRVLRQWSAEPGILREMGERAYQASLRFDQEFVLRHYERELAACLERSYAPIPATLPRPSEAAEFRLGDQEFYQPE